MSDDKRTPDPDAPAAAAEVASAQSFAELVDGMLAGRRTPPALSAEDRTLLETAALLRAGAGRAVELEPAASAAIVDQALAAMAAGATADSLGGVAAATPSDIAARRARGRIRRAAPWAATTAAVAAAVLLALWPPRSTEPPAPPVAAQHRSRPADALIGRIARARAGDASARLDAIYADRATGYRALRLAASNREGGSRP